MFLWPGTCSCWPDCSLVERKRMMISIGISQNWKITLVMIYTLSFGNFFAFDRLHARKFLCFHHIGSRTKLVNLRFSLWFTMCLPWTYRWVCYLSNWCFKHQKEKMQTYSTSYTHLPVRRSTFLPKQMQILCWPCMQATGMQKNCLLNHSHQGM